MDNPMSSTYMEMFYSPVIEPSKVDEPITNYIWFIKANFKKFDEPAINLANFNE
jgi:hypothetical protein